MNKLQKVNAVILNELFPQCTRDARHAVHFDNWEFSGFVPDPSSMINLVGRISARYKRDGTIHSIRAMIDVDVLGRPPVMMFGLIDAHLLGKINLLIDEAMASVPVSGCCGAPIDYAASIPLCVKCNGEVFKDGRVYSERHQAGHNDRCGMVAIKSRVQPERSGGARFYIEVADVEGGYFRADPDNPGMFVIQDLAERAAESALNRFPVARVLEEKLTMRRKSEVERPCDDR